MEWPPVSHLAIVLGVSCSCEGIDPDSPEEIARHAVRVQLPIKSTDPIVADIAQVIRARNKLVADILAARRPQGSLFPEPATPPRPRAYRRK